MIAVDTIRPVNPEVKSPMRMDNPEFTVTLPNKIVHNNKLPLLRSGNIAFAYSASVASSSLLKGPFVNNSRFLTSNPSKPRLRPEKVPDNIAKPTITQYYHHGISTGPSSG